jgi:cellulose synthase/poly-beta-1,6-N-acetylglucosamine synthase-like glycosyltransferase
VIRAVLVDVLGFLSVAILVYYLLVNGIYLLVYSSSLLELRTSLREDRWEPAYSRFSSPFLPEVAIVVPAYNEAPIIADSVQALLDLNYSAKEIVVVNDGSTDDTLDVLTATFDLEKTAAPVPIDTNSERVRAVYRAPRIEELTVIDKVNGGKGDALNAGVWLSDAPLVCALDADSLIDREGLLKAVKPFLRDPTRMVATGGTVRVANGCEIDDSQVTAVTTADSFLPGVQEMEYLRAFYAGRLGYSRLDGLILISGAFGLFRTDLVREIGGYNPDSITEDFELVVRLHRHLTERNIPYSVDFVPEPVVWTQAPGTWGPLARQRRRWFRGLIDTLVRERDMIGNPRYGRPGLFAMPAYILTEVLGPLIEGFGYVLIPLAIALGALDAGFFLLFLAVTMGFGVLLSWFGVLVEVWGFRRYTEPTDVLVLLAHGVFENVGFRQWKAFVAWHGLTEYVRGDSEWGEMTRQRFTVSEDAVTRTDEAD